MKNSIVILFLICALFSCKKSGDFDMEQYPQKWQLIRMSGQVPNSETTGANMEWQEYYLLNSDGTFVKSRERDTVLTEESGTFLFEDLSDGNYLILTYETDNGIIGNCTKEPKEVLALKSNNKLFGTWLACDGPGLEYKRTK